MSSSFPDRLLAIADSFTSLDTPPAPAGSTATIIALIIAAELRGYAGTITFHNASLTLFPQIPFEAAGNSSAGSESLTVSGASAPCGLRNSSSIACALWIFFQCSDLCAFVNRSQQQCR